MADRSITIQCPNCSVVLLFSVLLDQICTGPAGVSVSISTWPPVVSHECVGRNG